ncbi:MAG: amino acid permease [Pseudomonadota bacterium]
MGEVADSGEPSGPAGDAGDPEIRRSLGVWTCMAIVIGNVIGAGFFLAPAALAPYGAVALIGWLVMAVGAMSLGLVFARLSRLSPKTGGPYAYTKEAFGNFAGFIVAWGYWIAVWSSMPAIALAIVEYLHVFVPALSSVPISNPLIALIAMWGVAMINMIGVKEAGRLQLAMVGIKLVPLLAVSLLGLFWVDWSQFTPINPSPLPFFLALSATAPLIMFAFSGVESATVPAGDIKNPRRTIAIATIGGTLVAAVIYTSGTMSAMGVVGLEALAHSDAPFADTASIMWGPWAADVMAAAAILSSIAALNGWTLMMAQVPMVAAQHGLLPKAFGDLNRKGVPAKGIAISMGLATSILVLQASGAPTLIDVYDFIVNLSITTYMVPYVFCCFAEGIILITMGRRVGYLAPKGYGLIAPVAFLFSMWTIYGAGADAAMWGFLLILAGLPVYMVLQNKVPPAPPA